ncbi:crosslink repair DNA glycosylase YcaQ family protein [Candidatus Haliotispira prima]|uniref:Crosslink repair DNA glycosylase YcaQ family protein n=1 Tax=Candidatus Haliotispira prima TaxID=3034016 RepID=A0ABY8MGB3_9SPIO|nr:crosslink repair DNA glycosylase YcaQ family protein [Candidatus Haliotispira prima]
MNQSTILKQIRRITLQNQGLSETHSFGKGKKAVLSAIEHLGYIQIDTLSVVERAHNHTLWTRIPDYKSEYLEQLVAERKVFQYWFHAASYLPMADFRFALPQMLHFKRGESRYYNNVDPKVLTNVMDRIRLEGPQKARNFESVSKKSGSWWNWKPTKAALEKLFMQGNIMVCGRDGMEKMYDLTERVLPGTVNTVEPGPVEYAEYLVKTHLRAYGVTTVKQITHLRTGKDIRKNVEQVLQLMMEDTLVQQINIDGLPVMYATSGLLDTIIKRPSSKIRILSPFDNAIIHRERLEQLFNLDYRLECYTPKEKRKYGYFSLPILFRDKFIGRVDCKAHRKIRELELIHLHIENRQTDVELWLKPLGEGIQQFAAFNNCQSITLSQVSPAEFKNRLTQSLNLTIYENTWTDNKVYKT